MYTETICLVPSLFLLFFFLMKGFTAQVEADVYWGILSCSLSVFYERQFYCLSRSRCILRRFALFSLCILRLLPFKPFFCKTSNISKHHNQWTKMQLGKCLYRYHISE
ncbi:hypothetical protein BDA99DRAFT_527178 [Phascolomyces articulosus]|uniref:Secreted protein n=1 Tax=Phascolomyces articulosus TaxID=60185 RepID=A0AAD5JMK6_9FUNG|nr:hypothetical protein BDA99DRAFT_527178 [Phascolomyces articulosus]